MEAVLEVDPVALLARLMEDAAPVKPLLLRAPMLPFNLSAVAVPARLPLPVLAMLNEVVELDVTRT